MENEILPPLPPGISDADFLYHSSKKRTFTVMSQQDIAGESHIENGFTRESSQQHRTGSLSGNNVDGTSLGLFSAESVTFRKKPEEFQFHGQNTCPEKVHNNDVNHNLNVQPQSFQYRGYSSLIRPSGGETPWPSNYQPKADHAWPTGENKTLHALKSYNASVGKAETDSSSQHHTNSSHGGTGNQSLGVGSSFSESLKSSDVPKHNLIKPGHPVDFDAPGAINRVTSDFKQNGQDVNSSGAASPKKHDDLKQAIAVAASPRNHDGSVNVDGEHGQKNNQCHGSLQSNKKAGPLAGTVGLAVAEKLWNGSLQLNSSVNITAVAFFKSGEKIPDTKWSESVEVKGKVRLEAFEKYIQDLPRSRNRGLMVISLRLKDGSSEAELAKMKQVATGYKEGKKVGFAQLSPGTDLYICPRSDAIITILAKHGFFKGKAAVQEDHDSFIGCVVWRRKQALPSSAVKKSEKKKCSSSEQPPSSPSEKTSPLAEPASKSTVALSTDCTSSVNSVETLVIASEARLDGCSTSTMISLPVSAVSCSSSSSMGLHALPCADSTSVQGPTGQSLKALAPLIHYSGQEKPKPSLVAPVTHYSVQEKPKSSLEVKKRHVSINEDDDLPEYDFGFPSSNSQMRTTNEKLSAGGYGKKDGPPLPVSTQQLQPTLNQRRPENVNVPRLPPDAIEKMSPVKRVSGGDLIPVVLPALIDATSAPWPKNLFDDDDDIPEWRPPERTKVSTVSAPSIAPNLPAERLYPPRPPCPPPLSFHNNPPLPTQPRPRTAAPVSQPRPLPFERHVQKGPRPPVDLPVWRSWRP